jgi:hypothetical protein
MEIKEKEIKEMTQTTEIKALWSVMDDLEEFLSYFKNLPIQIRQCAGEIEDVYEKWCEDEITYAEIESNPNKMSALLISFINFMWSEMETEYQRLEERANEEWYKMECHEASTHFEDYMNVPFPEVEESRVPDMIWAGEPIYEK